MSEATFDTLFYFVYMDDLIYLYAVSEFFRYNPLASRQLIELFDDPALIFNSPLENLVSVLGNEKMAMELKNPALLERSRREIEWSRSHGVQLLAYNTPHYPALLAECADAPIMLFYLGSADLNKVMPVSIVGTRLASGYGREIAGRVVDELYQNSLLCGKEVAVVSGLAYGIDVAAHRAALEVGVPTIGVLPCGIDLIYPSGHREIARRMVRQGGILTEFPHGTGVRRWQFLKRNRIIAGISGTTIVVESRIKGGAMSSVEFANSYGRDVYAVPGRLGDSNSFGCNYLISKNVAQIYTHGSAAQICGADVDGGAIPSGEVNLFSFDDDKKEKILLSLKDNLTMDSDALCRGSGLSFDEVSALLLELELEGRVEVVMGNRYRIAVGKSK